MRKFSKIAASALALALSVTLVAPISANAQVDMNVTKTKDAAGAVTLTTTTYTNTTTGATITLKDGTEGNVNYSEYTNNILDALEATPTQYVVEAKKPTTFWISAATYGGSALSGFASSKKKIATVKELCSDSTKYNKEEVSHRPYIALQEATDTTTGKTTSTYYYKDSTGAIVTTENIDNIPKTDTANYAIYITGKKAGKSQLKFNVLNSDGAVIGQKSVDIVVKADARAVKSITYASKNVFTDTTGDGRADYTKYIYDKKNVINGQQFTTKKSGKIKIKMNKGYKIEKVLVGKLETEAFAHSADDSDYSKTVYDYSGTCMLTKVDLNGDGDYDDTIDGIDEDDVEGFKWTSVGKKSSFKLTLGTKGMDYSRQTSEYDYTYSGGKYTRGN
jgi:hypothetical protein